MIDFSLVKFLNSTSRFDINFVKISIDQIILILIHFQDLFSNLAQNHY